jgi:hypothetical protein
MLISTLATEHSSLPSLINDLAKIINDREVPVHIKNSVCENVLLLVRLKAVRKYLLQDCNAFETKQFVT